MKDVVAVVVFVVGCNIRLVADSLTSLLCIAFARPSIRYDDGTLEYGVHEEMIQALEHNHRSGLSGIRHKWKRGEYVDVNYKSRGRWIPARIAQLRYDGTYDIL